MYAVFHTRKFDKELFKRFSKEEQKEVENFETSKFHLCFISGLCVTKTLHGIWMCSKTTINKWNFVRHKRAKASFRISVQNH